MDKDASRFGLQRGTWRQVTQGKVTDGSHRLFFCSDFLSVSSTCSVLDRNTAGYYTFCLFNASLDMLVTGVKVFVHER